MEIDALNRWLRFDVEISRVGQPAEWLVLWEEYGENLEGNYHSPDWRRETRATRCALISPADAEAAIDTLTYQDLQCETALYDGPPPYFRFGEERDAQGVHLESFVLTRKNRRDRTLIVEVRLDFVRFHSLVPGADDELQHPIEASPVVRFERNRETREIERVLVYRDFLRDYLAAREKVLLVSHCIDRSANCSAFDDLNFAFVRGEKLARGLRRDLEPHEGSAHHGPSARCILWHTLAIPSFDQMKVERNPWYIGSATPAATGLQFRVGPDGTPLVYEQAHPATFLYFDRAVLERYVGTPDYWASLHQRYWGGVRWQDVYSIPVGINDEGLVTVLFGDIAEMPSEHQAYWQSYNRNPLGGPCKEQFAAQMQNDPVRSLGLHREIEMLRQRIGDAFQEKFGQEIFEGKLPEQSLLRAVSIGPRHDTRDAFCSSMQVLYEWLVEPIREGVLRQVLKDQRPDKMWKSLRLLQEVLVHGCGQEPDEARQSLGCLEAIRLLRQPAAHLGGEIRYTEGMTILGLEPERTDLWRAYHAAADILLRCLENLAIRFETGSSSSAAPA